MKRKGKEVPDKYDILGPLLNEVGRELADIVGGNPEGVFLYVEIGEGWVGPSVFREEGPIVRYHRSGDSTLSDAIFDVWYAESDDEAKRWSVMEYSIKDGKFEVAFKYPDEVDVSGPLDEGRREAALRARFGDKEVVYPPLEGAFELKP